MDEGKFCGVTQEEVRDVRSAWCSAAIGTPQQDQQVKITTVIVTKRHNTRLYPKEPARNPARRATPSSNCLPGTVVESIITMPYHFDFYLLSQNAIKGTGRPAHYIVLQNEIAFSPGQMHNLTNILCYTYARSTTSVSYVSAAYHADNLCERVKQYLRPLFDGDWSYEGMDDVQMAAEVARLWDEGGRQDGNPWNPALDDTMFWM